MPSWLTCPSAVDANGDVNQQVFAPIMADTFATCFEAWARPIHDLTCKYVFPEVSNSQGLLLVLAHLSVPELRPA